MKILIHGDDLEKSRDFYLEEKNKLKNPKMLNGDGITFDLIFQASESTSLFDSETEIIIENLFSKNKTNTTEFKKIVEYLNSNKNLKLILWEQNQLTKTQIALLKDFAVNEFIFPKKMFVFLDNVKPNNSTQLLKLFYDLKKTEAPELILFMLIRQFRLYLQIAQEDKTKKIDEVSRMAPWQLSKLITQSKLFSKSRLTELYNQLFEIELKQKTGINAYSLEISIDFFLSGL